MELVGAAPGMLALFVGFGLLIGVLFGFFGMGGSFLVTPALLVMDYPAEVAVGSGMAFVFGTSVIATLKHRDLGQVDYKLGGLMIVGTAVGIEIGKELVLYLRDLGLADGVVSVVYVGLLGGIGLFVTREALGDGRAGRGGDLVADGGTALPAIARRIQSVSVPPVMRLRGGIEVSLWVIMGVALATGVLSGFLGVGGGFIRMPALFYLIGVPVPVAVGTDLFEIMFSGGIGSFIWALEGGVDLGVVVPLLAGSALGARLGSALTRVVDEGEIKVYFGLMLIGGALAVAIGQVGEALGVAVLGDVSLGLIVTSALLVAAAVVISGVRALRDAGAEPAAAD